MSKCLKSGVTISFILFSTLAICQQVNSVVPPSPTIGTLKQFGDFPMDYSTGTISISVPIHTIQTKDFSIPIAMNFNARGRMGGLNYSALGVGWALNCVDYISKEIKGKPDNNIIRLEQTKESFLNIPSGSNYDVLFHEWYEKMIKTDPERTTLNGSTITYPAYDVSPDVYSYSVNGRSGKYIVRLNDNIVHLTYSTLKFSLGMEVLDESGNLYRFGATPVSLENTLWFDPSGQPFNIITTWYLSQIITNAGETINYDYESINTSLSDSPIKPKTSDYTSYIISKRVALSALPPDPIPEAFETVNVSNTFTYIMPLLKSITYPTGKVEFVYSSTNKKLESINVLNASNQIIKTAEFTYINTPGTGYISNNNSISLSNLKIKGRNGNPEEQYGFEYYDVTLPYSASNNNIKFASNVDWWGYSNSNGEKVPVIPGDIDFANGVNNCKDPDEQLKLNGMLKKIVYPTGGYTEFAFENNTYQVGSLEKDGPGLRITEIKSTAGYNSKPIIKKISYGDGMLPYFPNPEDFRTQRRHLGWYDDFSGTNSSCIRKTYSPFPVGYVSRLYSMPVFYGNVTEAQFDEDGNSLGRTEYQYNIPSLTSVLDGYHLKYIAVKEWTQSQLREKKIFKTVGSTSTLIELTTNTYTDINYVNIPGVEFVRDQEVYLFKSHPSVNLNPVGNQTGYLNEERYMKLFGIGEIYTFINRPVESAISVKTKEVHTTNGDNGTSITVSKEFEYGNLINALPTKQTTTGSDTKTLVSTFKYTSDLASGSNVYANMVSNRNMVNNLIEQTDFVDGNQIKYVKTNYFSPHTNLFVPQNIVVKNGTAPQFTAHEFKRYNVKAGILEQQSNKGPNEVYLWGYKEQYPVAQVKNAAFSDVAYTTFEAEEKGGWTFSGSPINDVSTPSGKMAYNLSGGNLTKSISSTTAYVISYWRPSNLPALTISGTQSGYPITGRIVNGWKYIEHKISGVTTATLGSSGLIDEVRLYPANAQMSTYTYDPLIGLTSECDANNRITYYEYDGLGRLNFIKDQDKNILKQICYNYAGQPENCTVYESQDKSGNFTRACSTGYTGSSVYVSIPAASFTSTVSLADANNQAMAYGQQQANLLGTCTQNTFAFRYTNAASNPFVITLTNVATSQTYTFPIPPMQTSSTVAGQILPGYYNVSISPAGGSGGVTYNYQIDAYFTSSSANTVTASNIYFNCGTCTLLHIY